MALSTPPKYRSIASSSAVETGSGSGSSFSTVQDSGSMGRSFDFNCLELMPELFLAIALAFGMRLGKFGDVNQVKRCGLDALARQPLRQMVEALRVVYLAVKVTAGGAN